MPPNTPRGGDYQAYTQQFDRTVTGQDLVKSLGIASPATKTAVEQAWELFLNGLQAWRTGFHIKALQASNDIRASSTDENRADTAITLLVDHSGSMRGQKILLAAAAVDVAQDFLRLLGCRVEILGFTTRSWKGGDSRRAWMKQGRPAHPGRLCDLLHIVYRDADDLRAASAPYSLKAMLWPELLKENIDGEALQWALSRLQTRPEAHKVLIVISDGAPVDDSTLLANDEGILDRHLGRVVSDIENEGDIVVAAVGIGFDVSRYYRTATVVETPENLGDGLLGLLENVLKKIYVQQSDTVPS